MSRPPRKKPAPSALFRDRVKGLARLPASRIEGAPKNFRTHDDRQRRALDGVLSEVGIAGAAVAWVPDDVAREALRKVDGPEAFAAWLASYTGPVRLIDGHLRRERLAAQGQPVLVTDLDEREAAKALATFDAVSDLAGTDAALLASLLAEVGTPEQEGTADLLAELRKHLPATPAPDDEEEEPVIPTDALVVKWGTAAGQLWVVPSLTVPGREHRLLCGDCRDPANVARLRGGRTPKLGLHDPPYGINAVRITARGAAGACAPAAPCRASGGVSNQKDAAHPRRLAYAPIVGDNGVFDPRHILAASPTVLVMWGANCYPEHLPPSAEWIVWQKLRDDMGDTDFSSAELAFVSPPVGRSGHVRRILHVGAGGQKPDGELRLHPTQKPIKVQEAPIVWYTEPGHDVEDWYMGAGAVIIACERTGRIGHGMDIAAAYLAATLERLSVRGLTPRLVQ